MRVVVDTNVARVADGKAQQAGKECVRRCIGRLQKVMRDEVLLLDSHGLILEEYLRSRPFGMPRGPGDAFVVWAFNNQANPRHCKRVQIHPVGGRRGFREFPADARLRSFDADDRMFVAVALASGGKPPIVNAVDTDWHEHREALRAAGVTIEFLCPELMG